MEGGLFTCCSGQLAQHLPGVSQPAEACERLAPHSRGAEQCLSQRKREDAWLCVSAGLRGWEHVEEPSVAALGSAVCRGPLGRARPQPGSAARAHLGWQGSRVGGKMRRAERRAAVSTVPGQGRPAASDSAPGQDSGLGDTGVNPGLGHLRVESRSRPLGVMAGPASRASSSPRLGCTGP